MIKSKFSKTRSDTAARILCAAVGAVATLTAAPAMAQDSTVDEIVITGTSIRGAAPVGANVIAVDRRAIDRSGAQTVQQLLTRIPQVAGFNNTGQWAFASNDASGTHAPTIHSLGASASNSTLILIDGRRLPLSGLNHNLADPNVIAPSALERVEVLPDGASAVYGSDAVAGVLNFITRRNFDGVETSTQRGFGDGYDTTDASVAAGKPWDGGSVFVTYAYTHRDNVSDNDRPFVRTDLRTLGGNNFGSFNCTPAAIQPGAGQPDAGQRFLSPYATGTGMAATVNPCDVRAATNYDIVPDETRHRVLAKLEQRVSDSLTASAEVVYSSRINKFRGPYTPGATRNLTAITVFGPGSTPPGGAGQINPFFRGPAGVTTETIFVNFDPIWSWPKPKRRPHPPVLLGGETDHTLKRVVEFCEGWFPRGRGGFVAKDAVARLKGHADAAGRAMSTLSITVFGAPPDRAALDGYRAAGISRALLEIKDRSRDEILKQVDEMAKLLA